MESSRACASCSTGGKKDDQKNKFKRNTIYRVTISTPVTDEVRGDPNKRGPSTGEYSSPNCSIRYAPPGLPSIPYSSGSRIDIDAFCMLGLTLETDNENLVVRTRVRRVPPGNSASSFKSALDEGEQICIWMVLPMEYRPNTILRETSWIIPKTSEQMAQYSNSRFSSKLLTDLTERETSRVLLIWERVNELCGCRGMAVICANQTLSFSGEPLTAFRAVPTAGYTTSLGGFVLTRNLTAEGAVEDKEGGEGQGNERPQRGRPVWA
ncbi:hypothetical protein B0H10DRAFT_1956711 [Mycena sp. CBHHK59/15]|nr:hypothetical protein B0H10DRAFT_1956711 [Mycena sp. CBHHK59/15]